MSSKEYLINCHILLSLIHISEPTRQAEISYAVFCLKTVQFDGTCLLYTSDAADE